MVEFYERSCGAALRFVSMSVLPALGKRAFDALPLSTMDVN